MALCRRENRSGNHGNFYGVTYEGGATSNASTLTVGPSHLSNYTQGVVTILHSFGDGTLNQ